jgi:dCMP deaminase
VNPIDTPRLRDWALGMAKHTAQLSKDPSTKVGAVIFDPKRRIVSAGYNGFARGVNDTPERLENRDVKYRLVLHAEKNAIMFATAPLEGCTIVVTHPCCAQCAAVIIQSGIKHVVWAKPDDVFVSRWAEDMALTNMQFAEAGVTVEEV